MRPSHISNLRNIKIQTFFPNLLGFTARAPQGAAAMANPKDSPQRATTKATLGGVVQKYVALYIKYIMYYYVYYIICIYII